MNFRSLIEKAMFELHDEFAALIQRKLEQLMGDAEPRPARGGRGPGRPRKTAATTAGAGGAGPKRARKAPASRTRAPADHMAVLRDKVLSALQGGATLKKSQILSAAELAKDEDARVASVLRKLKDEGLVVMRGQKAAATYTLRA